MSCIGEVTGVFGLLGKAWSLLRDRLDPPVPKPNASRSSRPIPSPASRSFAARLYWPCSDPLQRGVVREGVEKQAGTAGQ